MRTYIAAKIQDLRVTGKSVDYYGSVSIDMRLMRAIGIDPFEQVHVVNLCNGARWITYAIPSADVGAFTLNGGGARLGELTDRCVIMTFKQEETFSGAYVLYCDALNAPIHLSRYDNLRDEISAD